MDVEIVVGPKESFYPYLIESAAFAELFEGRYKPIPAAWISSRCGRYYHDFLLDDDSARRVALFGEFVVDSVGRDRGALLLFPSLLSISPDGPTIDPTHAGVLADVLSHLAGFRVGFRLSHLGTGDLAGSPLERCFDALRGTFAEGCRANGQEVEFGTFDVDPNSAMARAIFKNRTVPRLREQIVTRLHERGFVCPADMLAGFERTYGRMAATLEPGASTAGARDLADFLIEKALFR